ncbi:protease [Niveomyces insectorum RCEF 264]|uniref:Protease n=1 Tax=Niveomyces insectorum RCEF 264 TaxID=1081102 RepID=A0A167LSI3_9HYPO|nr:protease [Niveomyces insectorum RCEF 264]
MWHITPFFFAAAWVHLTSAQCAPPHQNQIRWVNCSQNVPSTLDVTDVDLARLPPELHCGRIAVPMDYARPQGPNNTIELNIAMIRPPKPNGVLFVNTGGSDPVAVVAWQIALNQTTTFSSLSDYYDLMFMDIRGTFGSNPLNVSLEVAAGVSLTCPTNKTEFQASKQSSAAFFQSWIENSTPPGIVQFVSTKEVVQDYEQIRKALGYSKIHFLGESYGTFRGQKYAMAYPNRVGHFALDSGVPFGMSLFDEAQAHVLSGDRALLRADAFCQNDPSCPFYSEGAGSVPKAVQSIFSTLPCIEPEPIPLAFLQQAVYGLLANGGLPDFPLLLRALEDARNGNCTTLLGDSPLSVESVVAIPLECGDRGAVRPLFLVPAYPNAFANTTTVVSEYNKVTFDEFSASYRAGLEKDTTGIAYTQTWQLQLACLGWPFPAAADTHGAVHKEMLLVTADYDSTAATEWTSYIWENVARAASLVVRHGDGHISYQLPDAPSSLITREYLRTGVLPKPRDDALCSVHAPRTRRGPIPNPYLVQTGRAAGDIAEN